MAKRTILLAIVCVAVCIAAAQAQTEAGQAAEGCVEEEWTWKPGASGGPETWSQAYPNCSGVQWQQSPINLASNDSPSGQFQIKYLPFKAKVENLGYKLIVHVPNDGQNGEGGFIEVGGKKYNLADFHFHVESEHTVNGIRFAVEVHLVHEYEKNRDDKAAIGILYRLSDVGYNRFVEQVVMAGPLSCSSQPQAELDIDPRQLFERQTVSGPYYAYSGSLTTPDCIRITWLVAETPSVVNCATYARLEEIVKGFRNSRGYKFNNRPLQDVQCPVKRWTGKDLAGDAPR